MKKSIEVTLQIGSSRERAKTLFPSLMKKRTANHNGVVNQLASMFIEENLKAREQQAEVPQFF